MDIRQRLIVSRDVFIKSVEIYFQNFAKIFGFPDNKGMPILTTEKYFWNAPRLNDRLPVHHTLFPPDGPPTNIIDIFIGPFPKPDHLDRYYYESDTDGFYNFYFANYKNMVFLPNWLSEFLQIRCNLCLDISILETFREALFVSLVYYSYILSARMIVSWFMIINPYTWPFSILVALIDWFEDATMGALPSIAGVSLLSPLFSLLLGKIADSVNHLVFTMPFLPSEGVPAVALVDGKPRDVLLFRYLPILWYKHPIPNDLREYWFTERRDILEFMQNAYKNVDIQFLPDSMLDHSFNLQRILENLLAR